MTKRRSRLFASPLWLDAIVPGVVILGFYSLYLTTTRIGPGADLLELFLPMKALTRKAFFDGVVPLWNPYTFGGAPFLATMQAAVLYPPNLLAVLPAEPILGIHLYQLFHLWLMAAGVHFYLRRCQSASPSAALGAALALPCGAYTWAHLDHLNQLAAVAWFPWWMVALWFCVRRPSRSVLLWLGGIGALQWLAGHPQQVVFTLLLSLAYLASAMVAGREARRRPWLKIWATAGGGVALAALLAGAQLLPTLELGPQSVRELDDFGLESTWPPTDGHPQRYAARFAMEPSLLIQGIHPRAWRHVDDGRPIPEGRAEAQWYPGLLIWIAAAVGMVQALRRRWRERLFWIVAAVFAVLFAMGDATPLHWAVSEAIGPLRHFRAPPRLLFVAVFALAILAASGWDTITAGVDRRRNSPLLAGFPWLFALLVFVDLRLAFSGSEAAQTVPRMALERPDFYRDIQAQLGDQRLYRLMPHDGDAYLDRRPEAVESRRRRLAPNNNMYDAIALIDGYEEGLLPLARSLDFKKRYYRNFYQASPDAALLGLMGVGMVMAEAPLYSPYLTELPERRIPTQDTTYQFYQNHLALGAVVSREILDELIHWPSLDGLWTATRERELETAFATIRFNGPYIPGEGRARSATNVDEADRAWLNAPATSATVWTRRDPGLVAHFARADAGIESQRVGLHRWRVRLERPEAGRSLALLQTPYPGWILKTQSSDRDIPLTPLCAIASRIDRPPGAASQDAFEIVYEPASWRVGLFISMMGLTLWIALLVASWGLQAKSND